MAKNQTKNPKGQAFERYVRQSDVKYKEIADQFGVSGQTVNNWKARGVPSKWAVPVATMIGCRPDEISQTIISQAQADQYTGYAAKKREAREALNAIVDATDDPDVLDVLVEQAHSVFRRLVKR